MDWTTLSLSAYATSTVSICYRITWQRCVAGPDSEEDNGHRAEGDERAEYMANHFNVDQRHDCTWLKAAKWIESAEREREEEERGRVAKLPIKSELQRRMEEFRMEDWKPWKL